MAENTEERELDWNDEISDESGGSFKLLPKGEYPFVVKSFARGRFKGSPKMKPCNTAELTLLVNNEVTIEKNLFLNTKCEWMLCAFFRAIGAKSHGKTVCMDWGKVPGAAGMCKVTIRKWTGKDGSERESNEIDGFIDPPADEPMPDLSVPGPVPQDKNPVDLPF